MPVKLTWFILDFRIYAICEKVENGDGIDNL